MTELPEPGQLSGQKTPAGGASSAHASTVLTATSAHDAGSFSGISEIAGIRPSDDGADPLLGRVIGDVTIVRVIAEGGMGRVYEGQQRIPARSVAFKVMRTGFITAEGIRRFAREAELLGTLHHPNIAQVYWAGSVNILGTAVPYIVMEFVPDALPITTYARNHGLGVAERLQLFQAVCDAVGRAHSTGVVHRDIKPGNVLVGKSGEPKLIDFGIAKIADASHEGTALTEFGRLIGTVQYMSPEQIAGETDRPTPSNDVYALGLLLHEMITGRRPYEIDSRRIFDAVRVIRERKPVSLATEEAPQPIAWLEGIVEKCLACDPRSRFQTASELSEAILEESAAPHAFRLAAQRRSLRVSPLLWPGLAGASLVGVIASGVLVMPSFSRVLPSLSGRGEPPSQTAPPEPDPRTIKSPNFEVSADPANALMRQPVEIVRSPSLFRFAMRDVHQDGADTFLIENVGMKKWIDNFMFPRVSYWAPEENDKEGVLVYRFDLGGISDSITLWIESNCWDFSREPGGVGRGASAIELSRDGVNWIAIENNIEPRRWGASIPFKDQRVPESVLGSSTLWLRVRCITEGAPVKDGYNVAQFARTRLGQAGPAVEVTATLRPKKPE